jgi:hypothetical protein
LNTTSANTISATIISVRTTARSHLVLALINHPNTYWLFKPDLHSLCDGCPQIDLVDAMIINE